MEMEMAETNVLLELLTNKSDEVPSPTHQVQAGYPVQTVQPIKYGYVERPPQPPDHVGLAFFSMISCFWPLGIFALVFSFRSRYKYIDGDFAGAKKYSSRARKMARLAILFGVVMIVCIILLEIFAVWFVVVVRVKSSLENINFSPDLEH